MDKQIIIKLNQLNKTGIYEININDVNTNFGFGKIKVCSIVLKDIIYQFIICDTNKLKNKLLYRYFNKVWSEFYQEMDYIDDNKHYFYLNYTNFIKNKHYDLLIKRGIKSITFTKYDNLFINGIKTKKG